ncbi:hypothetical protein [Spiroplasma endosymbiont of Zeiraphera isertana]|uniref:hypothetical protein n=1 Tax=Spiroplasma endosymbiont of Zeiraphera isertana TaxID=3066313 RepID=UPI00313B9CF0
MKYFNPTYWFKLWLLSAPLFNSKSEGIYAKSIDNQNIKDWASKNTSSLESINQEISYTNSSNNYQSYSLNETNQNIDPFYQSYLDSFSNQELETSTHKHRHEKSRRIKKQVTPHPRPSRAIFQLSERLIIRLNNPEQYRTSFQAIINELAQNNILLNIPATDNQLYILNPETNYGYFRLPVRIIQEQNGQSNPIELELELVLSADALYIQGFIINHHDTGSHTSNIETYYYFNPNLGTPSGRYNPQLTTIPNINSIMLNHIGNAYRHLLPSEDTNIYWTNIYNAFLRLTIDINVDTERPLGSLALSLGRVILMTAEALRFREWENIINRELIINRNYFSIGLNSNNNYQLLIRWGQYSQTHLALFLNRVYNEYGETDLYIQIRNQINQRLNRIRNFSERNFMTEVLNHLENTSIDTVTRLLLQTGIRIFLLISPLLYKIDRDCTRGKRDITNKYWHEKFCDLKPEIDKIQGKITTIKVLENDSTVNPYVKKGYIFLGTTKGLYTIHQNGNVNNIISNINIKNIIFDEKFNNAYVTNQEDEIYHLNLYDWGSEKTNTDNISEEQFKNIVEKIDNEKNNDVITAIKVLDENTQGGNLKAGTIYVGTENGVYLIYPGGQVHKFEGLNFPIKSITLDGNGSAYVINDKCEFYHLNLVGWGSEKTGMESCDLNKELILYYNEKKEAQSVYLDWWNHGPGNYIKIIKTFNLNKIIPIENFKKFEFLGKDSDFSSRLTWGSETKYINKANKLNGKKITDLIINEKITDSNSVDQSKFKMRLEDYGKWEWGCCSGMEYGQILGLTFYWENNNYFLQLISRQWAYSWGSSWGGYLFTNIGNGIRLYNDDYDTFETQIPNPNDRKRREIYEEKNENKWTDDYTKSINHEQNLAIDNKPNFSKSNITSI